METRNELQKLMKWGKGLDIATTVIGRIVQVGCAVAFVAAIVGMLGLVPDLQYTMHVTWLGNEVDYASLAHSAQTALQVLFLVVTAFAFIMVQDLMKALHNVFRPMSEGRPFEEGSVKGFRRAALWTLIISILSGEATMLFVAALLLLLSYVFRYGVILQTESDETL